MASPWERSPSELTSPRGSSGLSPGPGPWPHPPRPLPGAARSECARRAAGSTRVGTPGAIAKCSRQDAALRAPRSPLLSSPRSQQPRAPRCSPGTGSRPRAPTSRGHCSPLQPAPRRVAACYRHSIQTLTKSTCLELKTNKLCLSLKLLFEKVPWKRFREVGARAGLRTRPRGPVRPAPGPVPEGGVLPCPGRPREPLVPLVRGGEV